MGRTGKWIKNLLTGKKDHHHNKDHRHLHHQDNNDGHSTPISTAQPTTPKEKRRWSFRRSSANGTVPPVADSQGSDSNDSKKNAMVLAAATAAAAEAAVAAAKAAAAVIQLTAASSFRTSEAEDAAAVKIQSVFRGYLARKALNALKGLVKLQALVRGHLVRKQATATLRCMQALVTVQARARAQRLRMVQEASKPAPPNHHNHRKSTQDFEENIKIVEMDIGGNNYKPVAKSRNSCSSNLTTHQPDPTHRIPTTPHRSSIKHDHPQKISPSPSAITDVSPRTCSNHFEEYYYSSFGTAQSSPQCYSSVSNKNDAQSYSSYVPRVEYAESLYGEYPPFYPSYMANTESSRAKVRSHSAPKQRPAETMERPVSSRRRPSLEGRNVPRAVRMQRSSSHVGSAAAAAAAPQNYQYPWSVRLDRSAVSLKDSECGSTSTVATNVNYCRSLVGFDVLQGGRY